MLESKRLPREMILKKQTPANSLKLKNECLRLMNFVNEVKESMRKTRRDRDRDLAEARQLTAEANRLSDEDFLNQKISIALDVIGLVFTGGSATAAKRALGEAIGAVGSVFGLISNEKKIKEILLKAQWKMEQFEAQNNKLDHFEKGLRRAFIKLKKLGCPLLFAKTGLYSGK